MGARAVQDRVVSSLASGISRQLKVERVILFGSHAKGGAAQDSDYDFVIVSPDFEGVPFIKRSARLLPLRERGVSYDFLCYTPAEFNQLSSEPTIVREAAREGVRII